MYSEINPALRRHAMAVLSALGILVCGFFGAPAISAASTPAGTETHNLRGAYRLVAQISARSILAQADPGTTDENLRPKQVERYIAVYKSMQRNHSLTVKQAAAKQGLTVNQFRDIEAKIERNDQLRERVRQALKPDAKRKSGTF